MYLHWPGFPIWPVLKSSSLYTHSKPTTLSSSLCTPESMWTEISSYVIFNLLQPSIYHHKLPWVKSDTALGFGYILQEHHSCNVQEILSLCLIERLPHASPFLHFWTRWNFVNISNTKLVWYSKSIVHSLLLQRSATIIFLLLLFSDDDDDDDYDYDYDDDYDDDDDDDYDDDDDDTKAKTLRV